MLCKLHVLVVHFPIALLVAAAAGEAWSLWRRHRPPVPAVRFCVLFGAAGAVLAAALGWLNAAYTGVGAGTEQGLALHRWLGTGAGVWAIIIALLSEREAYGGVRSWRFRIVLFIGALLVGVAAHLGGTLVYGENYFIW